MQTDTPIAAASSPSISASEAPDDAERRPPVTRAVRALHNGRLTLPAAARHALGLGPDDRVEVTVEGDAITIRRSPHIRPATNPNWFRDLYDYFAPVREDILRRGLSEEEVNADIDAAVRAVRAERRG